MSKGLVFVCGEKGGNWSGPPTIQCAGRCFRLLPFFKILYNRCKKY